jgi:hypothetical protein
MTAARSRTPAALAAWIIFCTFCSSIGWVLSACHQLNRAGYAVALALGAVAVFGWRRGSLSLVSSKGLPLRRWRHRFRSWLPRCFLLLASLIILGGLLYPPTNYDGLAYRTPRVLHWLAAGHWHWILTGFNRLNTRGPGFEWISALLICLTGTDRFLFLISTISFCLLPGLVFSVFRRLGVGPRAAWHWMWLAPTGYCFALQAGGIGNDLTEAVFALAALDFALRARVSKRAADLCLAMLAAALMTGVKSISLPLLLPLAVAMLPALPVLRRHIRATIAVALLGCFISFVPIAAMNVRYGGGDWTGAKAENAEFFRGRPLLRLANNSWYFALRNLAPPIFPLAGAWNRMIEQRIPASWQTALTQTFEGSAAHWQVPDMEMEEYASLGLGVSGLLLVSLAAGVGYARRQARSASAALHDRAPSVLILGCAWLAYLVVLVKTGMDDIGRLSAPYYLLLAPTFLLGSCQCQIVRSKWWRKLAAVVMALAVVMVILSPGRPLWPANALLAKAGSGRLMVKARMVYELHAKRADALAPARDLIPDGVRVVGLVSFDDPETSLWRPFGSRRIEHLTPADTLASCQKREITYVVVHSSSFDQIFQRPLDGWIEEMHGAVVGKTTIKLKGAFEPSDWILVRFAPPPSA